jgi:hypothetical protein
MKRTILIIGIILLLVIVAVGVYFLFSSPKSTVAVPGQTTSLPTTGSSGGSASTSSVTMVFNQATLDYFVNASGTVTVIEPSGEIIQIVGGETVVLNSLAIQNIISASFSYNGEKILVNFGDPSNPQTSVFDISSKAWTPMNSGLYSPVWSPADYRIAYYTVNADAGTESFATVDASKPNPAPVGILTLHAQAYPVFKNVNSDCFRNAGP